MVGGRDYAKRAVQPRHPGPAPAGLVVQAVRPGRGAHAGHRAGLGVAVAQARLHRPRHARQGEVRRQQLRGQLHRRRRRSPARLTFSDNSVYAAVGIKVGTKQIARMAERMGIRTPVSTNPAMTLGGLQAGRHAARHGPRLRDVRRRRPARRRHARRAGDGGPVGIREVGRSASGKRRRRATAPTHGACCPRRRRRRPRRS